MQRPTHPSFGWVEIYHWMGDGWAEIEQRKVFKIIDTVSYVLKMGATGVYRLFQVVNTHQLPLCMSYHLLVRQHNV